ncbi:MAG: SMC family ATPase [Muribaculaceae bacterium]|nr:SMC family ATPase [Muribaculaceae bacterium]
MKFRTLTIHNIASIADAEIHFDSEPLADADVFLICGETGAGKSTILDAICLALFDAVPRLGTGRSEAKFDDISSKDYRQLLRSGTSEGFVQLSFTGNDGRAYEARWRVWRTKKKINDQWTLVIDGDTASALSKKSLIEPAINAALNIDYQQFVRTSMLAQGDFTRFLDSDDANKARILEKLTGVGQFAEIGAEIYRMTAEKESAVRLLRARAEGTKRLSDEELAAIESRLAAIDSAIDKLAAASRAYMALKGMEQSREELRLSDEAIAALEPSWRALKASSLRAESEKKAVEAKLEAMRADYERGAASRRAFEGYDRVLTHLSEIASAAKASAKAAAEIARLEPKRAAGISELEAARLAVDTDLKVGGRRLADCDLATLERGRSSMADRLRSLDILIELAALQPDAELAAKTLAEASATAEQARELFAAIDFGHKEWAVIARAGLHEGCECPVCRQRVEALPPVEDVLNRQWVKARDCDKAAREAKDKAQVALNAVQVKQQVLQGRLDALSARIADLPVSGAERDELRARLTANIAALEKAAAQAKLIAKIEAEIGRAEAALGMARASHARSDSEGEKARAALLALPGINERIEAAGGDLNVFASTLKADKQADDKMRESINSLAADLRDRETRVKAAADAVENIIANIPQWAQLSVDATAAAATAMSYTTLVGKAKSLADKRAAALAAEARYAAELRLYFEAQPDFGADAIDALDNADGERLAALKARLAEADGKVAELNREKGALGQQKAADAATRRTLAELFAQIESADRELLRYQRACKLFGDKNGDTFRNIALSFVLENLLEAANTYLAMLTDRYRLVGEEGSYLILLEDAYNACRCRPVVTSSGGESFMVSLALALALADMGTNFVADTLFIDEGFGTLSGEPLHRAVGMLRSLNRTSGRRVGIISHVAELKTELPVQIRVDRNPAKDASTVSVVG